jgi:hypothetical protein
VIVWPFAVKTAREWLASSIRPRWKGLLSHDGGLPPLPIFRVGTQTRPARYVSVTPQWVERSNSYATPTRAFRAQGTCVTRGEQPSVPTAAVRCGVAFGSVGGAAWCAGARWLPHAVATSATARRGDDRATGVLSSLGGAVKPSR